jgi:hypothetical protein
MMKYLSFVVVVVDEAVVVTVAVVNLNRVDASNNDNTAVDNDVGNDDDNTAVDDNVGKDDNTDGLFKFVSSLLLFVAVDSERTVDDNVGKDDNTDGLFKFVSSLLLFVAVDSESERMSVHQKTWM